MPVIEVSKLRKTYGKRIAVDEVSFTVEEGEIFGIVGPNGAGKTTTVESVTGLRRPSGGEIRVLGHDPLREPAAVREKLGVQLQDGQLPDRLRVGEALDLFASFYRDPADPGLLLEMLGLTAHRKQSYKKLSGGQKQRLSIALALTGRPRIAVLDELTTGLDPAARRGTWALIEDIRRQGVTIVLVSHFMEEAERLCDRVAIIEAGRVAAIGSPAGLAGRLGGEQRIHFRPSGPLDGRLLADRPEVTSVTRTGDTVVVTGTADALLAVTSTLARHGVVAHELRVEQPSLEDAFVAVTSGAGPSTEI